MEIHTVIETRRNTHLVVMSAAAQMPNRCKGVYRRVAIVECDVGSIPAMISERARGVRRVVATWEKCHAGRDWRSARDWNDPDIHARSTAFERAIWRACDTADALALDWATDYPLADIEPTRSTCEEL